jgi:uncharacterized membrane protein YdbT with pleckstrin-like domain
MPSTLAAGRATASLPGRSHAIIAGNPFIPAEEPMAKSYLESLLAHNEKIEVVARQHWFVLLRWIILEIILIVVIGIVATFATAFFPVAALLYVLLLIPVITLIRDVLIWWNRQYVITSRRVIQVAGTFNKRVTDSSLEKVNDVKMVQSFFGRLFNFGDLEILTASEAGIDKLSWLADPVHFKTAMLDAKERMPRD